MATFYSFPIGQFCKWNQNLNSHFLKYLGFFWEIKFQLFTNYVSHSERDRIWHAWKVIDNRLMHMFTKMRWSSLIWRFVSSSWHQYTKLLTFENCMSRKLGQLKNVDDRLEIITYFHSNYVYIRLLRYWRRFWDIHLMKTYICLQFTV